MPKAFDAKGIVDAMLAENPNVLCLNEGNTQYKILSFEKLLLFPFFELFFLLFIYLFFTFFNFVNFLFSKIIFF